jgi:hypothetical protein
VPLSSWGRSSAAKSAIRRTCREKAKTKGKDGSFASREKRAHGY